MQWASSLSDHDLYELDPKRLGRHERAMVAAEKEFRKARGSWRNCRLDKIDSHVFRHTCEALDERADDLRTDARPHTRGRLRTPHGFCARRVGELSPTLGEKCLDWSGGSQKE